MSDLLLQFDFHSMFYDIAIEQLLIKECQREEIKMKKWLPLKASTPYHLLLEYGIHYRSISKWLCAQESEKIMSRTQNVE